MAQAINFNERSEMRIINNRLRRNRELRRHVLIFFITVVLMVTMSLLFFSLKANASGESEKVYKYYLTVEIKAGDTITSLSEEYGKEGYSLKDFTKEVKYINNLDDDETLKAGSFIVVPCFSTTGN